MTAPLRRTAAAAVGLVAVLTATTGCSNWRGLNSVPLPGTAGGGPDAIQVQAQLPDVSNIEPNSRVRLGDVTVGNVTKIERQGWHALITMSLDGDVKLPENVTATIGQTSLLGSLHIELAPPTAAKPVGHLHNGSVIPLASAGAYPSTEQTLAAVSLLLNGGGVGQLQDITQALSTAFAGRADELRTLLHRLDEFISRLSDQTDDIIAATDSLNNLFGQFAAQQPVMDRALTTIPDALAVLAEQREHLADALDKLGKFSAVTADSVEKTKEALLNELDDLWPVLKSAADAGPALTRSLSFFATFPWPKEKMLNWLRGDYANLTGMVDLTLSRLDAGLFTGTRWEGHLTELEMQWGRTIGQKPSPYTGANPLIIPYMADQGP